MLEKVTLESRNVKLVPIELAHKEPLQRVVEDGDLYNLFVTNIPRPEKVEQIIKDAIASQIAGIELAFVMIDKKSNKIVGSSRFRNYKPAFKGVEIGFTFIAKSSQKTMINTEAKYLMLQHAFETVGLNRVEFLTDYLNHNSRRAIARLGAKEEGVLRNHYLMPNGRVRDSVIFSIIKNEWIGIKEHLQFKLNNQ